MSRVGKVGLTAALAFFFTLVVLNNIVDYSTNYAFVEHVLSMDTLFEESPLRGRALTEPAVHRAFYATIIAWEALTGLVCWIGAIRLGLMLRAEAARFNQAKSIAILGLVLGCLLWLVAFLCVGGEWFAMWQSAKWNGQNAAFRMFAVTGIVLIFVHQPDAD